MQVYNYRLKVIGPKKKTNFIVREVHQFHGRFSSVIDLKAKLMEEFQEQVPETVSFNVGYFEGRQSTKNGSARRKIWKPCIKCALQKVKFCFGAIVPTPLPLPVMKMTVCLQRKNQEQSGSARKKLRRCFWSCKRSRTTQRNTQPHSCDFGQGWLQVGSILVQMIPPKYPYLQDHPVQRKSQRVQLN